MYCYRNVTLNTFKLFPTKRINNLYNSSYSDVKRSYLNRFQDSECNRESLLFTHTDSVHDRNLLNPNSDNYDFKNKYKLLSQVDSVSDLKRIPEESLPELCNEVRSFLGDVISKVGGHFSGSLGVTELTVALHYVFNSPFDKIVWDIGHQAYVHKILTGRRDQLCTIKQKDGLSGFCRIYESVHDIFGAGHSSTSISSLQGILEGYMLSNSPYSSYKNEHSNDNSVGKMDEYMNNNNEDRKFVCVIGDGGMTGGMAYESLNYAVNIKSPMIIVYNDNEQVSLPTGMKSFIGTKPVVPFFLQETSKKQIKKSKEAIEELFGRLDTGEEGLNVVGPIDGHNLEDLLYLFKNLKNTNNNNSNDRSISLMGRKITGPLVVHIKTVKGYCCPEALQQLDRMHSIKPNTNLTIVEPTSDCNNNYRYNKENWQNVYMNNNNIDIIDNKIGMNEPEKREFEQKDYDKFDDGSYGEVFANTLIKMAEVDDRVVAVTAAMPGGTCVGQFGSFFPNRTFDVGICEQHAVTFCGGLTLSGMKPYCALYSTFIQRGFDQVIHDIVIQNLPVRFVLDRAGYVGEDGLSHHGNYDLNFFRVFKNVVTMSPSNQIELAMMLQLSSVLNQPSVIRYPKDKVPNPSLLDHYPNGLYDYVKYYCYLNNKYKNENQDGTEYTSSNEFVGNSSNNDKENTLKMSFDKEWKNVLSFKSKVIKMGREVAILCLGPILFDVLKAVETLGINPTIVDMRFLNPLDVNLLKKLESEHKYIITVEESVSGGLGTSVLEYLADSDKLSVFKVKNIRYPYEFIHHATREQQKELAGIDSKGIETQIRNFLNT